MSAAELEQALRNLPKIGTLVKDRPGRQVWRFEHAGRPYYLKFYPRSGGTMKRLVRGSAAWREFTNLQALQKAGVPSPRAVAHLSGFVINQVKGDAIITEGIEGTPADKPAGAPAVQLDQYINELLLRGDAIPQRRELSQKLVEVVEKLGQAKLGHRDLHLGNFLLKGGELFLLDGYAVRRDGLHLSDVMLLGHSVDRIASKTELLRGWRKLQGGELPKRNPVRRRQWRKFLEASVGENRYFGKFEAGAWSGVFAKHCKYPRRWSQASRIDASQEDWRREWPNLLARIEADQLEILKRSGSGDVLAGEVALVGRPLSVVVKRARRRYWYRYLSEIGRGSRAARAWRKAWALIARDVPTAWPVLMMERRVLGYVVDCIIVFERVQGRQLSELTLDEMNGGDRRDLFRRLGRTLRRLEDRGLSQYDSKSTNWMIVDDPQCGPTPVVIDVDGIRRIVPRMWPIDRLLRSLRAHGQYTPEDSRELCLGYAPHAHLMQEEEVAKTQAADGAA